MAVSPSPASSARPGSCTAKAAWREQGAILLGAKYTTPCGISFIGEFYTPPNIPYYRDMAISPTCRPPALCISLRRQVAPARVARLEAMGSLRIDGHEPRRQSYIAIVDANRRFGNHFSSYLHLEIPQGSKTSDYGATPYTAATSVGVRFQL